MEKNTGVVLRVPSGSYQHFVVMDKKVGKIVGKTVHQSLQRGSLIRYVAQKKNNVWVLEALEMVHIPNDMAKDDILFLHHLLELCYYCLPIGSCARDMVTLFDTLYALPTPLSRVFKKTVIFKLLIQLGMYPDEMILKAHYFHKIATESIDTIEQAILDLGIEKELDQWLHSCVTGHPHAKYFKTLSLYQRVD